MNSHEIQQNVQNIFGNFSKEDFPFDLLLAYGISKTSVTRLKSGDFNLAKNENDASKDSISVLYKKKIFFKTAEAGQLLSTLENTCKDERTIKYSPRFAVLTDFKQLVARDLKLNKNLDIPIEDLPNHFDFFLPLAGSEVYHAANDNKADREASYKMAALYDILIEENPEIYNSKESVHHLNIFLSRLLFCFFAEDTGIFKDESIFTDTLAQQTAENGKDTHLFFNDLFDRLNTEKVDHLPEYLKKFEYVNGGLFSQKIESPLFTAKARKTLIELGDLNWSEINPDIFGSMIQAVVVPEYRSDLGMHYTSVENIHKLIKPLFLDELYEEFEASVSSASAEIKRLRKLLFRISKIKFFDPACGSGNFLIITYKEIRLLEIKILQRIIDLSPNPIIEFSQIQLSQFYGIEIDDFAHEMAILSLWLAEHQMNRVFEDRLLDYGQSKPILPLKEAGHITHGNATRLDWKEVCPISDNGAGAERSRSEVYIIGNPPYLGARMQDENQKSDMAYVFRGINGYNNMDYIACWFFIAKNYIKDFNAKVAFVSTNSICQGEQVALIWPNLISDKIEIDFAYQSFKWVNNAKGNAGVTVIIVGLRNKSNKPKYLFKDNIRKEAKNINSYLLDATNVIIIGRSKPISNIPEMNFGSMANDNGNLILDETEKQKLITQFPKSNLFIKKLMGGEEFIKGKTRFCIWIEEKKLEEAESIKAIADRIEKVKTLRENSNREATRKLAIVPFRFGEVRHQETDSIIIPRTSSERRDYIPIGFLTSETVIADSAMAIYDAQPWLFAVIHSKMHMVWVNAVGGKLKTDYRYSAKLCYNTFPFPDINIKQKENLKLYVFAILDERAKHPEKTMAQLYNPDTMPQGLLKAHQELDLAIEQCYRLQPFKNDTERLEFLFKMYEEMVKRDTLFAKSKPIKKMKK